MDDDDRGSAIVAAYVVIACLSACAGFIAGVLFRGMWS